MKRKHNMQHRSGRVSVRTLLLACIGGFFVFLVNPLTAQDFYKQQLRYTRVREAHALKDSALRADFREAGLPFPPSRMFLRVFKRDESVEVWVWSGNRYALFRSYAICARSGGPGPKRRAGDMQIPEGIYRIARFNPTSQFLISMGIDYPNQSDRILGDRNNLGGDIYIHGNCVSIGCISVADDDIREIYLLAARARSRGQQSIPVHIFPTKMNEKPYAELLEYMADQTELLQFWENLKTIHDYFERNRTIPLISVDRSGRYRLRE